MGLTEADRVQRGSRLQVRLVALEGGQHATLILEHGRISKLVSPEGEVAMLQWQGKDANALDSTPVEADGRVDQNYACAGPFWANMHGDTPSPRSTTTAEHRDQGNVSNREHEEGEEASAAGAQEQASTAKPEVARSDRLARLLGKPPTIDLRRLRAELLHAPDVLGARSGCTARLAPHSRNVRAAEPRMHALNPRGARPVQQRRAPSQAAARDEGKLVRGHEASGAPVACEAAAARATGGAQEPGVCRDTGAGPGRLDRVAVPRHDRAVEPRAAHRWRPVPLPKLDISAVAVSTAERAPRPTTPKGPSRRSKVWSTLTGLLHKGQVHQGLHAAVSGGSSTLPRRVCRAHSHITQQRVVMVPSDERPCPTQGSAIEHELAPAPQSETAETAPAEPVPTASQPAGMQPSLGCIAPSAVVASRDSRSSSSAPPWTGMAGRWRLEPDEAAEAGAAAVEALLDAPLLQRLARRAAGSMDILETEDALEVVQDIALQGGARIRRSSIYPKGGAAAQGLRLDGRDGPLRCQLSVSPQGHCYIRSLQGEPGAAVFHQRMRLSGGGHCLKVDHKFQLLSAGVAPVVYHTIWHRVTPAPETGAAVQDGAAPDLL